jgi:hypothetical protein
VHACLRTNFATLSDACRKEELKLMILESSNTELMPNLARACKVAPATCSSLATGCSLTCCKRPGFRWRDWHTHALH